ncbi:uncharacterized protein K489DRAFT_125992 [Dissoconium aciculare CBS 342.82]|uniref:Uncharacterized protein n=1 Tax=Dissoconium aciculare CBS 342.82 TaxID=1314786 RepID=A0A6J3MGK9_9PEZI|nr:uncharacterized protein K489DRAFT_125992 [Dissoconium aciculare CBS 342.82]KAF1826814.1 hypothetical protein K489DRAFT_125992 [Dissoconium aciculare CBS 342.82]
MQLGPEMAISAYSSLSPSLLLPLLSSSLSSSSSSVPAVAPRNCHKPLSRRRQEKHTACPDPLRYFRRGNHSVEGQSLLFFTELVACLALPCSASY